MVVNRDPMKAAELTLTFADDVAAVAEVDRSQPDGDVRPLDVVDGKLNMTLQDGDGRLLELKRRN